MSQWHVTNKLIFISFFLDGQYISGKFNKGWFKISNRKSRKKLLSEPSGKYIYCDNLYALEYCSLLFESDGKLDKLVSVL